MAVASMYKHNLTAALAEKKATTGFEKATTGTVPNICA